MARATQPEPTAVLKFVEAAQGLRVRQRDAYEMFTKAGGVLTYGDFRKLWTAAKLNPLRNRGAE